jgi:hypothetical protein
MASFNVDAARKAGYNDQQIEQFMRSKQLTPQVTAGGIGRSVVNSGARTIGDLFSAAKNVFNPNLEQNTLANTARTTLGAGQLLLPGEQGLEGYARNVGDFYNERYGISDALKGDFATAGRKAGTSAYFDPVGVAMDVSTVAGGAGAGAKAAGLGRTGRALTTASEFLDPIQLAGKGMGRATQGFGGYLNKAADGLDAASETVLTRGIGNPAAQQKLAGKAGRSVGSFLDEYDLVGRDPGKAAEVTQQIGSQFDDIAMNSGAQVQVGDLIKQLDQEIMRLQTGSNKFSKSNQAMLAELTSRKGQLLEAVGATDTAVPLSTGVDTLTNFRREALDPDIPQSMFNLDAQGSGAAQGAKKTRDILRTNINRSSPQLEKLGKDYGMAKGVQGILEKSASRGNNRQILNFSKLGSAGLGGVLGGLPGAAIGAGVEMAANSPQAIKVVSGAEKGAAKFLRNAAQAKAPTQLKSIPKAYGAVKAARVINPSGASESNPEQQKMRTVQKSTSYRPIIAPRQTSMAKPDFTKKKKNIFSMGLA